MAVIDPTRDVDEYLAIAKRRGVADHECPRDPRPRRLRQRLGRAEGRLGDEVEVVCSGLGGPEWTPPYADRVSEATATRSRWARSGCRRSTPPGTPTSTSPGPVRRHAEQGGALAGVHRRLPVRRRRGAPRSAGRGGAAIGWPISFTRASSSGCRWCPTSPRSYPAHGARLAVRQGDRFAVGSTASATSAGSTCAAEEAGGARMGERRS